VLAALPLLWLVVRAIGGDGATLALLLRPRTLELVAATLVLGIGVGAGAVALGVPLAWLTTRTDLPARRLWGTLVIAPLAVPSYLLAFAFVATLGPRGWVSDLLEPLGVTSLPSIYGLPGALLVLTLATTPYVVLGTGAALRRLDPTTEQVARSLGDGPFAAARVAVLPVVLPAVGAGALLAMLYAVSDFGAPSILRYDSLARAIHTQLRSSFDRAGAAAFALLLIANALALVWAEARIRRRAALRQPQTVRRVPADVALGRWRGPALLLCGTVVTLSLVLPAATILIWLVRGTAAGADVAIDLAPLRDSLVLGGGAAVLAVLLALPLAWLIVQVRGRTGALAERMLYLVYAIPGIALALAVVSFTLDVVPALYQTLVVLVVAVAVRYLIQPVGALRSPMLQVGPHTVEAARSLGQGPLGVARSVVLPLLRPGIVAAAALVFLSALKELPLTLLVSPTGFGTLATDLWDAAREGFYAQAAVPAALLLGVSLVSVGLLLRTEGRS
jgi:iron(III) transport system permease protein